MSQFSNRTLTAAGRLQDAVGQWVQYTGVDAEGEALVGYPIRVHALVRHEAETRTYAEDGDLVMQELRVSLRPGEVTPQIGDYVTIDGADYGIVSIDIRGAGWITVTAQRIYSARTGAGQAHQR